MTIARAFVIALLAALPFSHVSAEITLDGTMGPAGPLAGPTFTIPNTAGTTLGPNLFHSFSVFNIDSTESATFTGPAGLDNVISRVTGGAPSSIDGLFRSTVPGADIFFVNPAGVVFGPNAALDVPGAFHTSTADELRFSDGNVFSATDPAATVLTPATPEAFGFLGDNPTGITVNDSALETASGATLSLVGGDVTIDGSDRTRASPHLRVPSGQINIVGVAGPGEVSIGGALPDAEGFASYGKIQVSDSRLELSGEPGGGLYIRGGEVVIDSTHIFSDGSGDQDGGDFVLKGDSVTVAFAEERLGGPDGSDQPRFRTLTSGGGRGGDIRFEADRVTLDGGVRILSVTEGAGRGGDLTVKADRFEALRSGIFDSITSGQGRGGDVMVEAGAISILGTGGARPSGLFTCAFDEGRGGNIVFRTRILEARNRASIGTEAYGSGDGGDITVDAESAILSGDDAATAGRFNGFYAIAGAFDNPTATTANAGNVTFRVDSMVLQLASTLESVTSAIGSGGDVTVAAGDLAVRSGSNIGAGTGGGSGPAGTLRIDADSILLSGGGADGPDNFLTSTIRTNSFRSTGAAGDIVLNAGSLEILPGGLISSVTIGLGPGGSTTIVADRVLLDGGGKIFPRLDGRDLDRGPIGFTAIESASLEPTSGPAGNIDITAETVLLRGGAAIDASTISENPAGRINIQASQLTVESEARISTETEGLGNGGATTVTAGNLTLTSGGNITASSTGSGLAGDVTVDITDSIHISNALVTTEALSSDGGNITLNAVTLLDLLNSSITTSVGSGAGAGGNITIDPRFVIVQNSQIIANAFGGPGGNINITAGLFLIDASSVISASSALGIDGVVNIESPVSDVTSGVTELPAEVLDASSLVQAPCAARAMGGASSLTSAGRSGLPAGPDGYMASPALATGGDIERTAQSDLDAPISAALLLGVPSLDCS